MAWRLSSVEMSSVEEGEAWRFWLGLFRCATASHGVAVELWKVAISYGLGW